MNAVDTADRLMDLFYSLEVPVLLPTLCRQRASQPLHGSEAGATMDDYDREIRVEMLQAMELITKATDVLRNAERTALTRCGVQTTAE